MIHLSETADSSPIMRRFVRDALFKSALEAVEAGNDIEIVASVYQIGLEDLTSHPYLYGDDEDR